MVIKCIACHKSYNQSDSRTFHSRFPREIFLREIWLTNLKLNETGILKEKDVRVCSDHFSVDDIYKNFSGNHYLKFNTLPKKKARRKEKEGTESSSSGDSKLYLEATVLERKLPEMDMRLLVDLPAGLDYNEWLASHTMALFDHVNLVYGTVSEFCTTSGCPDMTGPGQRTYLWFDEKGKKTKVAAPQYIDYVMTFIQKTVSDETIFPTKYANEFPSSFESIVRKIVRLLFHVVAHLYAAHFKEVVMLGLHAHLNLTFAHLTALHHRFSLIEPKETEILRDLEIALRLTEDSQEVTNNNDKTENISNSDSKTNLAESSYGDNKP